jgi:methylated-DNA-[protein]-cysteine S-methyltransferase
VTATGRTLQQPYVCRLDLPWGRLHLSATPLGLRRVWLPGGIVPVVSDTVPAAVSGALERACTQLTAYFERKRRALNLPLDLSGLPDFGRRVLEECSLVAYGEVVTYGELARRAGRPAAARAVGRVMATNPLALIIPCHRVIGANGQLTGYGGGLDLKARLLAFEQGLSDEMSVTTCAQPTP